ncbi:hypothetical protein [Lutimaribacter saemankumensis]|uniref:Sulfotransferase family protein n=1 Tax=Lutimaribacter saemankumensis TaxID=490829 RepID=A0A1G8R0N1_9RHOB|nr:hypothetical protein [Lutimaribacter saemankumensis]SDJ10498.1 hypothetical protein SAMN05421850_108175 [Lutimaribacter saemankumensis]
MLVVHIGMGKTASTTLQKRVFPTLAQLEPEITVNDPDVVQLCRKQHFLHLSDEERDFLRGRVRAADKALLSMEGLVNTDPRNWERAANANLDLFGRNAVIVITVREPLSYLTSIYQQKIHEGHVRPPEEFFLSSVDYDRMQVPKSDWLLEFFDLGAFNFERLHQLYKERFNTVWFVPMSRIREFEFLRAPFDLSDPTVKALQAAFEDAPRENVAYSDLAMRFTFARERLLRACGARTIGFNERMFEGFLKEQKGMVLPSPDHRRFHELGMGAKAVRITKKISTPILSWRRLMQGGVNRFLPYRKYRLPELTALDAELLEQNRQYLARFETKAR